MTQPPIVPGPPPDEPQWHQEQPTYQPPASPPPYQQGPYPPPPAQYPPPPQVVYYQPQPAPKSDTVGKVTVGTITVVGVLILIFCVLPLVLCFGFGMLGTLTNPGTGPTP